VAKIQEIGFFFSRMFFQISMGWLLLRHNFGGSYKDNFGATMAILQMLNCEVFESMFYTTSINK
jgi:hypothetical protein